MITANRRQLLSGTGLAIVGSTVPGTAWAQGPVAAKPDLFVGTGGHGHTFPGPSLPFGMVQLGPDTDNARWDACSGYHRTDGSIMGFSHTHLSGTGIGDMLDVLVVPTRGKLELRAGPLDNADAGYRQRFSDEHAEPGYYRVKLESGVLAELTVTERVGLHRYRFPQGAGHILIDFEHMILDKWDTGALIAGASLALGADGMLTGSRKVNRWAKGRDIHFAMQLSRKPDRVEFFDGDEPAAKGARSITGKGLKVALFFDEAGGEPILIKTGMSGVSVDGARAALAGEAPGWNFDGAVAAARKVWARELQSVRVKGGTEDQRTIMGSALYHTLLAPTLFTDRDGRYMGMDRQVHQAPKDAPAFSTYSTWDTYRALHPLLTLIRPEHAAMFTRDLIRQTQQSPYGPPVWPLQGIETGCMIGWHSVVIMAEARVKGIEADYAAAWPNIRRRAFDPKYKDSESSLGRDHYYTLGYIPADKVWESVSRTQEYAYDDWAMAVLAEAAGAHDDAAVLRKRSLNYRNVIDPQVGFARPRFSDGKWWGAPFDPVQIGHMPKPWWRDYTEANGWQATFLNQHDTYGLIEHFGGEAKFEAKLDGFFNAPSTLPDNAPPDITGLVGQYAHGNEPDQHAAYLYAFCGKPWKTQAMIRRLLTEMYKADPDGVIGNDDCGQMSAWFVLSALGFYPVDPVSAVYVFGSPLFDEAEMDLGQGKTLRVRAPGNGPDSPYVQSVRWNGRPWTRNWISHAELAKGGELVFQMGRKPSKFGTKMADRPPSFGKVPG
ncbi:GH92 family glycosyl hydrolase [Sphingomonas sp. IC-56]|uniref:GH92 family glycosyl hydrolase n=1 Tax=Sphingomonas sp. IC-56 TaxID=2898529 RepID=UPI001E400618|nr:GH92 family glycosyl hydrolase [Sphingomonas sp. IC-56]MCD2324352.1 GH92 family glycosyl hydrolase [Sphingomonas sp. IC-56]